MTLQPGLTILDKYRIIRLVGEGGMARVWLAEEVTFGGRQVALKEPKAGVEAEDVADVQRRFQQEISLTASLMQARAPNIVPAWTVEPLDGGRVLVMQYMPGGSLEELLRQPEHAAGLPVERAVAIALDVLGALEALHRLPAEPVHRDVKPSNILFDGEGRACLADFGLAQLPGVSGRSRLAAGAHPATPMYAAPEQLRSPEPLLPAADLFALGCVLWEMLTGQRYKRSKPDTPPSQLRPDVPAWLDEVVMRALVEDPWERWSNAGEMTEALRSGLVAEQHARQATEAQRPANLDRRSRKAHAQRAVHGRLALLGWSAGAVAVLTVFAVIAWVLSHDGRGGHAKPVPPASSALSHDLAVIAPTLDAPTETSVTATDTEVPPTIAAEAPTITVGIPPKTGFLETGTLPTPIAMLAAPTSVPEIQIGSHLTSEKDDMEMVYVPAGEFTMGSPDGVGRDDERPQHTVTLDAFWIDKTEVTNAQFARFAEATGHQTDAEKVGSGWVFDLSTQNWAQTQGVDWKHPRGPGGNLDVLAEHPVVQVSWNDASAYCVWAGRRLPSEAEWEKAARGVDGRTYPWGEQAPTGDLVNFADRNLDVDWADKQVDDGYQLTAPVGSYPAGASPYGALDMAGNVWEWVADWYDGSYYAESPLENPSGPVSGEYRVLRGGLWIANADGVRASYRISDSSDYRSDYVGFRCARSP